MVDVERVRAAAEGGVVVLEPFQKMRSPTAAGIIRRLLTRSMDMMIWGVYTLARQSDWSEID